MRRELIRQDDIDARVACFLIRCLAAISLVIVIAICATAHQ